MKPLYKKENTDNQKLHHETMPKLEMDLNTRVFINLNPLHTDTIPLQGEFLGTAHYEFLILRLPSIPGLLKKLVPHMRIDISYLADGARNSFIAEVISHVSRPALLVFTTYPDRMSVLETRKFLRVTCALPVSLITPYGDGIGVVRDLSRGGCRVVLEMTGQSAVRKIAQGDRIVLQTVLASEGAPTRGIGLVRNVETAGSRLTLGISFDESTGSFVEGLNAYLDLVSVLP